MHSIAIFGGTFDPIHNGHLQVSLSIQTHFNFNFYFFVPCKIPVLKAPTLASNEQRVEMIKLALKNQQPFKLDLREIERNTPSYMVETLQSFREDYPEASITLILGFDAFLSLTHWHQWEKIVTLAHLLVINRDEFAKHHLPERLEDFLKNHQTQDKEKLLTSKAGAIYLFDAGTYDISSTKVREEIKKGADLKAKLPLEVWEYIKRQGLYL